MELLALIMGGPNECLCCQGKKTEDAVDTVLGFAVIPVDMAAAVGCVIKGWQCCRINAPRRL